MTKESPRSQEPRVPRAASGAKLRVRFTFPQNLVTEPVIWYLGKHFEVVTNIRRAEVKESTGWVILELEGKEEEVQRGLRWVREQGVRVDLVTGDIVEG
ncbi:MAG: NIL domain-containing protein [Dehalococcoidia bacterium]|nr:NIL domain-containing protein [Dehalococcoidia bacterium]